MTDRREPDDLLNDLPPHSEEASPADEAKGAARRKARGQIEPLEPRILMSATWTDSTTGTDQTDATTHADTFTGSDGADTAHGLDGNDLLMGGAGDDALFGDGGDDTLDAGAGHDQLEGGLGDDLLDGGAGTDTAHYDHAAAEVNVDLTAGIATGGDGHDTLTGIENVTGSSHDDTLTGDGGTNVLSGGAGNDHLEGHAGDDVLDGGAGTDTAHYDHAAAGVNVSLTTGTATGGDGHDTLTGIENVTGSTHDDTLTGDSGVNVLSGGAGNDHLEGGAADDVLDGGAGTDTAHYDHATAGVNVDLTTGTATGGDGHDTLTGIENVTGSSHDDTLTGDSGANVLSGGAGNDHLEGHAGDDVLDGGAGTDTAHYDHAAAGVNVNLAAGAATGGDGHDTLTGIENVTGSSHDDTLTGNSSANTLVAGDGTDHLEGGAGNDVLDGGSGIDTAHYDHAAAGVNVNLATGTATGGDGTDTLTGIENVTGSNYNDTLTGDSGANHLVAGAGTDHLEGGTGDDVLDGGSGVDTAHYDHATAGVNVDLTTGTATGGDGHDTLTGIENVTGSSYDDTLTGDSGANHLVAGAGTDHLEGGAGNDVLDGGAGIDTAHYEHAAAGVNVNLATGTATGGDGTDTLMGIENVTGSNYDDTLTGDANANSLSGGAGNDTLDGGAGNDVLDGGTGNDTASYAAATAAVNVNLSTGTATGGAGSDTLTSIENVTGSSYSDTLTGDAGANTLTGGAGNDVLDGGAGDDVLRGGGGTDTAIYSGASAAVNVDLSAGTATGGAGNDTLSGIESVTGSNYDDTLTGDAGANTLAGGAGNDQIEGGAGNDALDGGAGLDTAHYDHATAAVNVNLATGTASGGAGNDTLTGIENVTGSGYNDTLTGDTNANTLQGGAGNDTLDGGLGNDVLDGGSGVDTASFAANASAVSANLATGIATGAGTDTLQNVENLTGSAYNDTLTGDAGANTLTGGAGNDVLDGGAGDDVLDGGVGTDTATYSGASAAVSVDLSVGKATGGAGNDTLTGVENVTGSGYDDTLTGDANANVLTGGSGNDMVSGGAGNDTLDGGTGDDLLDGGVGTDTATYSGASAAVSVDLSVGKATGGAGNDTLTGVENVTGSSYNDTLVGDANANVLSGGAGNDVLSGGAGNDTLDGGTGDDTLDGGAGTDTAIYSGASAAVNVDLSTGKATGGAGNDTLTGIESVTGSSYNDTLVGDGGVNMLSGGAGDDILRGGAGNDTLDGGTGNDTLDGGAGMDTATYSSAAAAVNVDLSAGTATGGAGNDTITGIENVTGSSYNDTLVGDAGNNVLSGGSGNDVIDGGAGNDTLDGGSGTDAVSYASATASVTASLTTNTATGGGGSDTLTNFENLTGSSFNDKLVGNSGSNVLDGGGGDDVLDGAGGTDTVDYSSAAGGVTATLAGGTATGAAGNDTLVNLENVTGSNYDDTLIGDANANVLTGNAGNDKLDGGAGNDTLDGGAGDDKMDGGTGTDTVTYATATAGVKLDLGQGTATGGAGDDTLANLENVIGSNYDDTLVGDAAANNLVGGAGNDVIDGGGGNDTLDGGAGTDTVSFATATDKVSADLSTGTATVGASSDVLLNFENVTGSVLNDTLTGNSGNNALAGGAGEDTLDGGAGNDTLDGGTGIDTASYASAAAAVNANLAAGTATGGAGTDTLINIENVTGSGYDDTLTGDGGSNVLVGGAGNDTLDGGAGDNVLDGGAGTDTASYASASSGIAVDLAAGSATGGAGHDKLVGIENVTGSGYDDKLTGDAGVNTLVGGAGNDTLDGGAGNDILDGGAGSDTAHYATAQGPVTVNLATGSATGAAGDDTLIGIENVTGSEANDTLTGDANANVLTGGGGDDALHGGAGDDTLQGGAGDDTLHGGAGNDTLDGGAGHDTVSYADATGSVTVDLTLTGAQNTGGAGTDTLTNVEAVVGGAYDDTFAFSNPTNGAEYTVDGGGGSNTISLSNFSKADADIDKDTGLIHVTLPDNGAFTVHYSNVDALAFHDGNILTSDTPPVADAGAELTVGEGDNVKLDATGSFDPDGDLLTYQWVQTAGPSVTLSDAHAANPTFAAPEGVTNTDATFELHVSDGSNTSVDSVVVHINANDDAPSADAGVDQTVDEGAVVHLAGQGTDPEGQSLTYEWVQVSGPQVQLSDAHAANPTFVAPDRVSNTDVSFQLHVTDGTSTSIDTVAVHINADNDAPSADAGVDQTVDEGAVVHLAGQGTDPEGQPLTHEWVQVSGPQVQLSDPHAANPTFVAPDRVSNTDVSFELHVSDGTNTSIDTVTVHINADNDAPSADAGVDQTVDEGAVVHLAGQGTDPEGQSLTHEWVQVSGPQVQLSDPHAANPTFVAPEGVTNTDVSFELHVSDGTNTSVDTVAVHINANDDAPTANAGADQTVDEGSVVHLAGQGADPEGQALTYQWVQVSGPQVHLSDPHAANPTFVAPEGVTNTDVGFELHVSDGTNTSIDTVAVHVNADDDAPTANAGSDQTVGEGDTVHLQGHGTDPEGQPLTYEWVQVSGPQVRLSDAHAANPTFVAPEGVSNTDVGFELHVSDGTNTSIDSVAVHVNADNDAPTADAGLDQTVDEGAVVHLVGQGTDPEGQNLSYEWVQVSGPQVQLSDPHVANPTFVAPVGISHADVAFALHVSDGTHTSIDSVAVHVNVSDDAPAPTDHVAPDGADAGAAPVSPIDLAPTAEAGADQTVDEGATVQLHGAGTDPEGQNLSYEWVQVSGPQVQLSDPHAANPTFVAPEGVSNTAVAFELHVSDGTHTSVDAVAVHVNADNDAPVAEAGADQKVAEGDPVHLQGTGHDPEGQALTYEWVQVSGPQVQLSDAHAANPTFVAPGVVSNTDVTFELHVSDGTTTSIDTVTVRVDALNDAPKAGDDVIGTTEGLPVTTGNVLANDSDPNGDSIGIGTYTQPSHGTVEYNGDGTFTYTPAAGFRGADQFTYALLDGRGATQYATVNVMVGAADEVPITPEPPATPDAPATPTVSSDGHHVPVAPAATHEPALWDGTEKLTVLDPRASLQGTVGRGSIPGVQTDNIPYETVLGSTPAVLGSAESEMTLDRTPTAKPLDLPAGFQGRLFGEVFAEQAEVSLRDSSASPPAPFANVTPETTTAAAPTREAAEALATTEPDDAPPPARDSLWALFWGLVRGRAGSRAESEETVTVGDGRDERQRRA